MAEPDNSAPPAAGARGGDRRGRDRRRQDRRAPVPAWRTPWALVAYGVLGTLLLVLLFSGLGDDEEPLAGATTPDVEGRAAVVVRRPAPPPVTGIPEDAYTAADFERLLAEGDAAEGRLVRAELFCEAIRSIALRRNEVVRPEVLALADTAGRVPGAECTWGRAGVRGEDFLLLVPSHLAEQFARLPVVREGFVRRRRVTAELEWIGRSQAMSLRSTGVLQQLLPPREAAR